MENTLEVGVILHCIFNWFDSNLKNDIREVDIIFSPITNITCLRNYFINILRQKSMTMINGQKSRLCFENLVPYD